MKCLTASLPPISGSALSIELCEGGATPTQQWTFVHDSLRLAADITFGGSASDTPGSGPFLLRKCLPVEAVGSLGNATSAGTCDAKLHGWHGMSACFGKTPTACWIDLASKGQESGGCPPNFNAKVQQHRPADDTHCCVGPLETPAPPPAPLGRYRVANLHVAVAAPTKSYVFDVGGSGVDITNVTVTMPHTLSGSASVFHTTGTAFSITGCNATHDNTACSAPGYPRDCLLFFDKGTDSGNVRGNNFQMGCCAFEGYSASGVLLEDNNFTDLPWAVQPDGNGFASFGSPRVSERLSFSRNLCVVVTLCLRSIRNADTSRLRTCAATRGCLMAPMSAMVVFRTKPSLLTAQVARSLARSKPQVVEETLTLESLHCLHGSRRPSRF